jgi:hypothetical protein
MANEPETPRIVSRQKWDGLSLDEKLNLMLSTDEELSIWDAIADKARADREAERNAK